MGNFQYKGFTGIVNVNPKKNKLEGKIIDTEETLIFSGETAKECMRSFQETIDKYLVSCAALKKNPQKSFSGKLSLRISSAAHKKIHNLAKKEGVSINTWIEQTLEKELKYLELTREVNAS